MNRFIVYLLMVMGAILSSCVSRDNVSADRMNDKALQWLPANLDSAGIYAGQALELSRCGSSSEAMAYNLLGDIAFARMNYVQAWECYDKVLNDSRDKVEWLMADIGMMNIFQRISDNMSFYQYRDKALLELREIEGELETLSERQKKRVSNAETDLRIVSAIYFFALDQNAQGLEELSRIDTGDRLRSDTLRYLRWNTLRGLGVVRSGNAPSALPQRMRYLYNTLQTAERNGYVGQGGVALQGMASVLSECDDGIMEWLDPEMLVSLDPDMPGRLPLAEKLADEAIGRFSRYGSLYGITETYCLLGTCAIESGEYQKALDWLTMALNTVNAACSTAMPGSIGSGIVPSLQPLPADSVIAEIIWVDEMPLVAVPECMSRIREQMSIAYSGLGDRAASEYNRNVYLELQKIIRLDKRFEARQQLLRHKNRSLNLVLTAVIIGIVSTLLSLSLLGRAVRRRSEKHMKRLQTVMSLCQQILAVRRDEERTASDNILLLLERELPLVTDIDSPELSIAADGVVTLKHNDGRADGRLRAILDTVAPFAAVALRADEISQEISDDQRMAVKEHYLTQQHTEENRRQNLLRRASYSVVAECIPLIDRMVSTSSRLKSEDRSLPQHLEYISELATRLEKYGNVLTQWIKMCQGEVNLHIENFELQPLMNLLGRGRKNFSQKGLELVIDSTDVVVKADRTLTLFMMNTLLDNATKFTPSGGKVSVQVTGGDGWVELSVSDTGIGLSQEDVHLLRDTRVYDPARIGTAQEGTGLKGGGFGLMNCKGIIEKYRKIGDIFECCRFDVESTPGSGSRFSFRLPAGIRRTMCLLLLLVPGIARSQQTEISDSLLNEAYAYADSLYESNLHGTYQLSPSFAEKAVDALNRDYMEVTGDPLHPMMIISDAAPSELTWLSDGFATDYETILWIRNEVAVYALALNDMDVYKYNDDAYLKLFRQFYSDTIVENDCLELQRSNGNIRIAIVLLAMVLMILIMLRFVLHSGNRVRYRSDMQQVLKVTGLISESMTDAIRKGDYAMQKMADSLLTKIMPDIRTILHTESACLAVRSDGYDVVSFVPESAGSALTVVTLRSMQIGEIVEESGILAIPLSAGDDENVGAFAVSLRKNADETDRLISEMIARYMAVALHSCILRISSEMSRLERMKEESRLLSYEENRLHVQNMVMDNCLSTLKHETLSFPSRIRTLAEGMKNGASADEMSTLRELAAYYRDIFDILSRNVRNQLGNGLFKSERLNLNEIASESVSYVLKRYRNAGIELKVHLEMTDVSCRGDRFLIRYLCDNLLEQAFQYHSDGTLRLSAIHDGDYVSVTIVDDRPGVPCTNADEMFTPLWQDDNLRYVICRQIVRELDESMGHPGCRILAEPRESGGLTIRIVLPSYNENEHD